MAVATCAEDTPCFEGPAAPPVCGDECGGDGCGGTCGGCAEGDMCASRGQCLKG